MNDIVVDKTIAYGPSRKPWRESLSAVAVSATDGFLLVSPPSSDPLDLTSYNEIPGITEPKYQVSSSGLTKEEQDAAMEETQAFFKNACTNNFGIQVNQDIQCSSCLQSPFNCFHLNSAGDPFTIGIPFSGKWIERNVLDYYASLWNAKWPYDPSDPETYWGYILSMGSSEGNIHAMWSARNYLTTTGLNIQEAAEGGVDASCIPVVLYSQESNHSLKKAADITNLSPFNIVGSQLYPNQNPLGGKWEEGVPSNSGDKGPGSIDIDALAKLVNFFSSKGHPIVVIFNYGTTLQGACDDVKRAGEVLITILKKNNMYEWKIPDIDDPTSFITRKKFWFHVDGALSAAYMPLLEMAYKNGLTNIKPGPVFDFRLDFISSIVTSGHKWIGSPWPCGIYITKSGMVKQSAQFISYLNSADLCIPVSRNAHSSIMLWSFISNNSYDAQIQILLQSFKVLSYALKKLKMVETITGTDLWIANEEPSIAIVFRRPNHKIAIKYSFPNFPVCIDGNMRHMTHMFIMKHVTTELVDALFTDLMAPDAFINVQ